MADTGQMRTSHPHNRKPTAAGTSKTLPTKFDLKQKRQTQLQLRMVRALSYSTYSLVNLVRSVPFCTSKLAGYPSAGSYYQYVYNKTAPSIGKTSHGAPPRELARCPRQRQQKVSSPEKRGFFCAPLPPPLQNLACGGPGGEASEFGCACAAHHHHHPLFSNNTHPRCTAAARRALYIRWALTQDVCKIPVELCSCPAMHCIHHGRWNLEIQESKHGAPAMISETGHHPPSLK